MDYFEERKEEQIRKRKGAKRNNTSDWEITWHECEKDITAKEENRKASKCNIHEAS